MNTRREFRLAIAVLSLTSTGALAQGSRPTRAAPKDTTRGFPINDPNILANCTECHTRDSSGFVQRLSYLRKSPEGWEMSVRRMATLNKVSMTPEVARNVVRYLSNTQGLAPEEARAGRFEAERRMSNYRYADAATERVCRACHTMGRVILERRTRDEWELLVATHRGLYPDGDFQAFRRGGPPPPDSAGAPHPMDVAINNLSRAFPLRTPEWTAWSASMRVPNLEGAWLVSGTEAGKGAFFGRTVIAKTAGTTDEFTTRTTYRYVKDGKLITRTGKTIVYAGFQWRGRSKETAADTGLREVMFVEPGWQEMSGRWFKGGYDELGMDVAFRRINGGVMLSGVAHRALRTNVRNQDVTIVGANLPQALQPSAIDFGPGVRVTRVVASTADSVSIKVDVDSGITVGARDLFVAGAWQRAAIVVYDKVSRIKVTPLAGLSRVGGVSFPKQYQQFDAIAWSHGPDNKPDTPDDFEIGRVEASWKLEEYGVTYTDDDMKFVGQLDANGFFTPAVDGPNPLRSGSRNNIGDVWVVATWQPPEKTARPLQARAQLIVTVPLYVRFVPASRPMTTAFRRGEFHLFDGQGAPYVYLVPSAAVFKLDEASVAVLDAIGETDISPVDLATGLSARFALPDVRSAVEELVRIRAVQAFDKPDVALSPPAGAVSGEVNSAAAKPAPRKRVPLTTLVVNVTSKCNLACTYCYEYGEDKITEASTKPRFMNEETARQSVDFLFAESGEQPVVHLTFFGGETLLNFKVLKSALVYARERGEALGKRVDVSMTTNGTLLRSEIIDWIVDNDVGVTVSMDGSREQQDQFRVFKNGLGSYDTVAPNVKELLSRKTKRPVGARVTLTKQNLDVVSIYRHLAEELGFWEVGFAPVTTSWQRDYAIQDEGFFAMLDQFKLLAAEYLEHTLAGKRHRFSNVRDTLEEIHKGLSKSHPCGAGMGLMGVATDGDVALCHRFAGSDSHKLGTVSGGVNRDMQDAYLSQHHIENKTDCSKCWARPLCAGGCYHEAHTRYGNTAQPNLHYCEWIRSWTHTCLEVYGAIAEQRPEFLQQFD